MTAESFVIQCMTRGAATWAVVFGLITFVGGAGRWTSPAYVTALGFPGAPESLAIVIAVGGAILLSGSIVKHRVTMMVGGMTCLVWCAYFSYALGREAFRQSVVSPTGFITYLAFAVAFALLTWYYRTVRI